LTLKIEISETDEAHMLPDMGIIDNVTGEPVAQVFNFFEILGGKD